MLFSGFSSPLTVCASMQLPCWPPEGRKGSETPPCLASHDPHISRPPYFLIKTYMQVYMVSVIVFLVLFGVLGWQSV